MGVAPEWYLEAMDRFTIALEDEGHLVILDHDLFRHAPKGTYNTYYAPTSTDPTYEHRYSNFLVACAKLLCYFRRHQDVLSLGEISRYRTGAKCGHVGQLISKHLPNSKEQPRYWDENQKYETPPEPEDDPMQVVESTDDEFDINKPTVAKASASSPSCPQLVAAYASDPKSSGSTLAAGCAPPIRPPAFDHWTVRST